MASSFTNTTNPQLLKQYWNETFRDTLRENLVFYQFGMVGSVPAHSGQLVSWLQIKDLPKGGAITDGTDPSATQMTSILVSATLSQFGDVVQISDRAQATMKNGTVQEVMEHLGRAAALTLDTQIRDTVFTAGGSAQYAGSAVALNSIADNSSFDMSVTEVRRAVYSLEKLYVPAHTKAMNGGKYIGILSPDAKFDLLGSTGWQNTVIYTDKTIDNIKMNNLGTNFGVTFYETTQAITLANSGSANASTNTDVVQSYIFGNGHFGVAEFVGLETIVKNPFPGSNLNTYGTFGYKYSTAVKELDSQRMINVHTSTALETRS